MTLSLKLHILFNLLPRHRNVKLLANSYALRNERLYLGAPPSKIVLSQKKRDLSPPLSPDFAFFASLPLSPSDFLPFITWVRGWAPFRSPSTLRLPHRCRSHSSPSRCTRSDLSSRPSRCLRAFAAASGPSDLLAASRPPDLQTFSLPPDLPTSRPPYLQTISLPPDLPTFSLPPDLQTSRPLNLLAISRPSRYLQDFSLSLSQIYSLNTPNWVSQF
jgi:hypothetical protein